ncbi:3-oxoacyl-ACP synthase [Aequorivita echinoideorum]|uniref:3-oxoacyl-ACP synthase n=1 Tax=Aequorivita echinoideorum TaxID=1549647 RepID=A0ABS5S3F1_9FLAO|nr:3-oxoacyl-ACP synthase [Aequorivita echinoideorum]MBT0607748.1 3-oxoacyl-ACP synthase [Aequorivita echinoideorum]
MRAEFFIKSFCRIENGQVMFNGNTIFTTESEIFSNFSKETYRHFEISYPKFFKMDNLSKLAFLAAEIILKNENLDADKNNIALVFSNRASSLDTDRKHQKSIENSGSIFPSPAVFVYTLPNICLGEISIRHRLYSENSFFIFEKFNAEHLQLYAHNLLRTKKAEKVLCGWVEFDGDDYKAFLYLVEKNAEIPHTVQKIESLYYNE